MSVPSIFHEAALDAARRGWAVFPLKARDKIPATGHGSKDASKSVAQIDSWWRAMPAANVALATGPESDCWVLDVDGAEGEETLAARIAANGDLPMTPTQSTGKGRHFLFKWPAAGDVRNSARKLGPGLDVRGIGGYIVLAPSIHPSGRVYTWTLSPQFTKLAAAPDWLLALVIPPPPRPAAPYKPLAPGEGRASRYGEAALDSACARISQATPGEQNSKLTGEACAIGEMVASGEIERGYAERALIHAGLAMACSRGPWLPDQIASKVAWGLHTGAARPRKVLSRFTAPSKAARRADAPIYTPRPSDDEMTRAMRQPPRRGRLVQEPASDASPLYVTVEDLHEEALLAAGDGAGVYVVDDLDALAGGMARNSAGFEDWRTPRPHLERPATTMRWRGPVTIILPKLSGFTINERTKWARFISAERCGQVIGILARHWWRAAGASTVSVATLEAEDNAESAV